MLKLGIIGTNWIATSFLEGALATGKYELGAVYSRRETTAKEFRGAKEAAIFTDLAAFLTSDKIDVVYISSPNSFHYPQAKQALQSGKHVIVEKPAASTLAELKELVALAEEKELFFFEAARHMHEAHFKKLKELLPSQAEIIGANLSYMKYSSRYDSVLAGNHENVFSPEFSGGALMDLGIYPLYTAVALFGKPEPFHYFARKIPTAVDGMGTLILRYENFDVSILTGKIGNSFLPSEIYTVDQTIELDAINEISKIRTYQQKTGSWTTVVDEKMRELPLQPEAEAFAQVIDAPQDKKIQAKYHQWLRTALIVHEIMEEMRHQAEIVFPADK